MIKRLILRNFRGHTRDFEFGPHLNVIRGQNEAGKSTLKEAIAFAWFGSDSQGKSADHLISIDHEWTEVTAITEHATLIRRKQKGKTATFKFQQVGFPTIDLTQSDWAAKIKLSLETFTSAWNVGYFMSLPTTKQLAVLGEIAKTDRRAMLTDRLGQAPPEALKLDNLKVAADSVATKRRQLQNIKASEEGALGQLEAQITAIKQTESVDQESYQSRLNEINAILSEFDLYTKELSRYRSQFTAYQLASKNLEAAEKGMGEVKLAISKLPQIIDENQIIDLVKESDELKKEAHHLRTTVQGIPSPPKKPAQASVGECLTCGQAVTETHIKKVLGDYEDGLIEYNRIARLIQSSNDEILAQSKAKEDQARILYDKSVEIHRANDRVRQETNNLNARGLKYAADKKIKVEEPKAPKKPDGDEESLKKEQLHINTELNMVKRKATELESLLVRHEQISKALSTKEEEISKYGRLEKAILDLPQLEVNKTLETVSIPDVGIKLEDGDLSIVDSKGVPYQSLSSGKKMKISSLICGKLRSYAGPTAPRWLFVDDTDLMDNFHKFIPRDIQVFIVKVDPGLKDVVVDIL